MRERVKDRKTDTESERIKGNIQKKKRKKNSRSGIEKE